MSLITAVNLAKSFGANDIFSGVSVSIPRRARPALVGANGVGKTTLLRILIGLEQPSAGVVQRARGLRIGYLPQEASLSGEHTVWEECLQAVAGLLRLEAELKRLEAAMGDPQQAQAALGRYGALQQEFERRGGYTYETRIRQTLTGLGFSADDFQRPISQLSGGQRTRLALARLLLSDPDLLVLDEPTNHLDLRAVEWLEGYLSQWDGAALIVSHDRYFLDRMVDHVWEMSRAGVELYRGNYSAYLSQRRQRWEQRRQSFEAEKGRLLKELEYIKRNIAGQNTLQAKGRLRRLSRQVEAIESLGLEAVQRRSWGEISDEGELSAHPLSVEEAERRIRALRPPDGQRPPRLRLRLRAAQRSGDLVLRTFGLEIGYADEGRPLFRVPDLVLRRGECAALIGPNGAGKTTFLKTILGALPPYAGEVRLGASLQIAYFAQAHEDLLPENTLLQEIERVAPQLLPAQARDLLARFLFTGDDVYRQVSTLSGGERGRLALAKLSLSDANLLLLDEPTNHLDIPSQEALQEVLAAYQGTILLVSHDRYLIDALATQIWEIEPDEASMRLFEGTYSQYRLWLEGQPSARKLSRPAEAARKAVASPSAEQRRLRRQLQEVEGQIEALEARLASLAARLEHPPAEPAAVQRLGEEYVEVQRELEALMETWEALQG